MANRLELVYGNSQSGKTTWGLQIAEHLYVQKGLKTRWYLGDGGGATIHDSGLIDEGIIELIQFNIRPEPFATMQFCCDGYWPQDINAPWDTPAGKLVPTKDFSGIGLIVIEGLSVGCDYMMDGLADRAAKGEKIGQDTPYVIVEGGQKFGGNPPSHYGFAQRRLINYIERSRALPVPFVLWTAHQRKAEDSDLKGVFEFGPDCAGQALTSKIGAYFGNTIHMHQVATKKKVPDPLNPQKQVEVIELERRAYTRKHLDPEGQTGVKYFANSRMPREFNADMPEYFAPPDAVKFYQVLEAAKTKKQALLRTARETAERLESARLVQEIPTLAEALTKGS